MAIGNEKTSKASYTSSWVATTIEVFLKGLFVHLFISKYK
jgi:hypothetical protein